MKNDMNKVAETIAKEISKFPAGAEAEHGIHRLAEMTRRESEAFSMASWFLSKVEKMDQDADKEAFHSLRMQLVELAVAKVGK